MASMTKGGSLIRPGTWRNWWSDADLKAFNERAECIVKQFNGFEVEKGLFENGKARPG